MLISLNSMKETTPSGFFIAAEFHPAFTLQLIILLTIQHFYDCLFTAWVECTVKLSALFFQPPILPQAEHVTSHKSQVTDSVS